jgi:phage terminase large subunit
MAKANLPFVPAYYPLLLSDERHKLPYGGAGSGKSWAVAQHFLVRGLMERGNAFLVTRKVAATLRGSCFYRILNVARASGLDRYIRSTVNPLEIRIPSTDTLFIFVGMNDPEKLKSIDRVTSVWNEEGTELEERDYDETNRRLRGPTPGRKEVITTFNPISTFHWINRRFFIDNNPCLKLKTTYKDNPFIDEAYKAELEADAIINPAAYRVYTLGEWGTPEGRVYNPFKDALLLPAPSQIRDTFYGLDFGFSNSYTCLLRVDVYQDCFYVSELIYAKGLTTAELAELMRNLRVRQNDPVYSDPSEAQQIEELHREGFNMKPAGNKVKPGIDCVLQNHGRILTHGGNINFNREVATYCYKQDKHGEYLNDPIKQRDHAMDALRYAIYSHLHRYGGVSFEQ